MAGKIFGHAVAIGIAGLSVAVGGAQADPKTGGNIIEARAKLVADVDACSKRHGFDPKTVTGVAENALAQGELEWRDCVYNAISAYSLVNPAMSTKYDLLISTDIAMTAAIKQGTMTRSQRRQRIEHLLTQLKAAEDAQIGAAKVKQEQQSQQMQQIVNGMRGLGR